MSDCIKRFIEVFVPSTACNLKCSYCYLSQVNISTNQKTKFNYSNEIMKYAVRQERLGGICLFNVVADGETLLDATTMQFIFDVLEQGHYVNIVTNCTITKRIEEICSWPYEYRKKIMFLASFHYLELKRLGLLDTYFSNIRKIQKAGCSFYTPMVLCSEYIACKDEIKEICMKELGFLPQVARVRNDTTKDLSLLTDLSEKEYYNIGIKDFNSVYMKFERDMYHRRIQEFCYAGDWFFYLNLSSGEIKACYRQPVFANLFENPDQAIPFYAIGNNCKVPYCYNGISRIPLGVIPEIKDVMYYWQYRNCTDSNGIDTVTDEHKDVLSSRLYKTNREYSKLKRYYTNLSYQCKYEEKGILFQLGRLKPNHILKKIKRGLLKN